MPGWRGDSYLHRPGAAKTYEEARARACDLNLKSWVHYQKVAHEHNLPTGPQILWPDEWNAGGRYAGYLGTIANGVEGRDLVSGLQVRGALGISRKTWRLLSDDLVPDASVSHKHFYDPERVRDHVATNLGRLTKRDAIERLRQALDAWS